MLSSARPSLAIIYAHFSAKQQHKMASPRSLSNLAAVIQANAGLIESALKTSNSPPPSFALGSPPVLMISPDLEECRDDLVDALEELRALVLGPIGHLFTLMVPIVSRHDQTRTSQYLIPSLEIRSATNRGSSELFWLFFTSRAYLPRQ